jgi:hypothetical protein
MMVLIGSTESGPTQAQPGAPPHGGFGGYGIRQTSVFSVVKAEPVQKELAVTEDQKTKLTALVAEYQTANGELSLGFAARAEGDRPSPQEVEKVMADLRTKADKLAAEKKPKLAAILSVEQMSRLEQIVLQAKGGDALNDAEVQSELAITDDQKAALARITKDYTDKRREVGGFGRGPEGAREAREKPARRTGTHSAGVDRRADANRC